MSGCGGDYGWEDVHGLKSCCGDLFCGEVAKNKYTINIIKM
jgi:hypothetical protein